MKIKTYNRKVKCGRPPDVLPNLNRSALAREVGLTRVQVSRILSGYCRPRMDTAIKMAHAMHMPVSAFVDLLNTIK